MKILIVDGFLGRDCEVKTTAKGNKYLNFSMCNNTFIRGENKATWYNCSTFDVEKYDKMIPYLKKGKPVIVVGTPDEATYVGKDGSVNIDIRLSIDRLEFPTSSKSDENGNANKATARRDEPVVSSAASFNTAPAASVATPAPAPVVEAPQPTATYSEPDAGDDLPF